MIHKSFICAALTLMAISSVAQKNPRPSSHSFNNIFDSLIINDSYIPVSEYTYALPARDSLVYRPESFYLDHLKSIFDNPVYTNEEKIRFIKRALADTRQHAFITVEKEVIEFWKKNDEARLLMG